MSGSRSRSEFNESGPKTLVFLWATLSQDGIGHSRSAFQDGGLPSHAAFQGGGGLSRSTFQDGGALLLPGLQNRPNWDSRQEYLSFLNCVTNFVDHVLPCELICLSLKPSQRLSNRLIAFLFYFKVLKGQLERIPAKLLQKLLNHKPIMNMYQDWILGHQFYRRLEPFAPCYSHAVLLWF